MRSRRTWRDGAAPIARRCAIAILIAIGAALATCAWSWLSAALFLATNKTDPRKSHPFSLAHYWVLYGEDPLLRRKLIGSMGASALGLFVGVPAAIGTAVRRRRPLHGEARFATAQEIARAGLLQQRNAPPRPSILIGRYRRRYLALPGQLSVMLSAPTRSGKGVGVVVPNLLNWPDSVVALDIKGENFAITAGYRAERGHAVYAFSPFDEEGRSHRWNPLSSVRTEALHRVGDLLSIGQVLFPSDHGTTSSEAFFNDQARNLFLGLGLLLLESPMLPRTIGEMLRQSSGNGRPLKDHLGSVIVERRDAGSPLSQECVDALQRLLSTSENTLTSIVATFNAPLTIFADAVVDAATSADDFDLADVKRRRMAVYVRVPPNRLTSARPLLNLFFSQLVSLNTRRLPVEGSRLQCLLINDEFTSMGRVGIIASAAAFLAGYDLRLVTVVQAMSQLDSVYGDREARTFATNHGLQILFAPREQRDAEEYSAMLGNFTETARSRSVSRSFSSHGHTTIGRNESDQRRALLLPQEFRELGADRLIAIVENCKPILAKKIRYHRDPNFIARLRAPPPVPSLDIELHFATVRQRWSYLADDLSPDVQISVEALAHNFSDLPELDATSSEADIETFVNQLFDKTRIDAPSAPGGSIEPASDQPTALDSREVALEEVVRH